MSHNKTAVIIGAGIGGITTALYLAKSGYSVKIFEKNASAGGRCGQIIREGHRFDLGATILLMPSIYRTVFQSLDIDFDHDFQKYPLDTLYKIYFENGPEIEFTTRHEHLKEQLERIEKGSYQKAIAYIDKGYSFFNQSIEKLLGRNFTSFSEFATFTNLILLIKLKSYIRHRVFIKRYFQNPFLQKAFTFQNIYVGQNPLTAPALFAMIPASELSEGSFFPKGGMYGVTEMLLGEAGKMDIQFYFNKPVTRIITENKKVTGIITQENETIPASVVVANADLPYVHRELLDDRRRAAKIDSMKFSCSAIVLHWGLDMQYNSLKHHNVFLSKDYRHNLAEIFKHQSLGPNPSFYVHAPARTDPAAAPSGEDSLSVIIPSGHLGPRNHNDWNELKTLARSAVLRRLKEAGLNDIERHIKFEICYLPQTWKSIYNLSRGATFGSLAHNIFQMGYFRPHNRHPRYHNLYFTGGSTHPGNGVPLVLLSAKLTAERILTEIQHD